MGGFLGRLKGVRGDAERAAEWSNCFFRRASTHRGIFFSSPLISSPPWKCACFSSPLAPVARREGRAHGFTRVELRSGSRFVERSALLSSILFSRFGKLSTIESDRTHWAFNARLARRGALAAASLSRLYPHLFGRRRRHGRSAVGMRAERRSELRPRTMLGFFFQSMGATSRSSHCLSPLSLFSFLR